jgi:hypothetical protein
VRPPFDSPGASRYLLAACLVGSLQRAAGSAGWLVWAEMSDFQSLIQLNAIQKGILQNWSQCVRDLPSSRFASRFFSTSSFGVGPFFSGADFGFERTTGGSGSAECSSERRLPLYSSNDIICAVDRCF